MKPVLPVIVAGILACSACSPDTEPVAETSPPETPRQSFRDANGRTVALMAGQTLYLSAMSPEDAGAPIADQTGSAMDRLGKILAMAGLEYRHVVSCHVHLSDMDNYADMNSVYGSYFPAGGYPARTTLEVPGLPEGAAVLLMCMAYADASEIEVIRPPEDRIPAAMGPYSPAVRAGNTFYLSGQGGRDPATGELAETAGGQAERTLATIGIILDAAGLDFDNAVLAATYSPASAEQDAIDSALAGVFSPGAAPSRANVILSRLPGDIAVEITVIAVDDSYVTRLFIHDQPPTASSSPASLSGGVAYMSAMPGSGATFREQFLGALQLHESALGLALMQLPDVVRITAYLSDLGDLQELRSLVSEAFPESEPALTAFQAHTPDGAAVVLETIAVQ